ncbi:hypothetical protein K523DRAFT_152456 [Schizophyllum commune Tattone D]|nr:hypothetical protein K523DRAFT_152456 [Schizophyllum commune Tattone D]
MNHSLLQDTPHLLPHPAVISPPNSATLNAERAIAGTPAIAMMALGRTTRFTVAVMHNALVTGTSCARRQRAIQQLQVRPDPLPSFAIALHSVHQHRIPPSRRQAHQLRS